MDPTRLELTLSEQTLKLEGIPFEIAESGHVTCNGHLESVGDFAIVHGRIVTPSEGQEQMLENLNAWLAQRGFHLENEAGLIRMQALREFQRPEELKQTREEINRQVKHASAHAEDADTSAKQARKAEARATEAAVFVEGRARDVAADADSAAGLAALALESAERAQHTVEQGEQSIRETASRLALGLAEFSTVSAKAIVTRLTGFTIHMQEVLREEARVLQAVLSSETAETLAQQTAREEEAKKRLEDAKTEVEALRAQVTADLEAARKLWKKIKKARKHRDKENSEATADTIPEGLATIGAVVSRAASDMANRARTALGSMTNNNNAWNGDSETGRTSINDYESSPANNADFFEARRNVDDLKAEIDSATEDHLQDLLLEQQALIDELRATIERQNDAWYAEERARRATPAPESPEATTPAEPSVVPPTPPTTPRPPRTPFLRRFIGNHPNLIVAAGLAGYGALGTARRAWRGLVRAPGALLTGTTTALGSVFEIPVTLGNRAFQMTKGAGSYAANIVAPGADSKEEGLGFARRNWRRWVARPSRALFRGGLGLAGGTVGLAAGLTTGAAEAVSNDLLGLKISYGPTQTAKPREVKEGEDPQAGYKNRLQFGLAKDRGVAGLADTAWNDWWVPTMNVGATSILFRARNQAAAEAAAKTSGEKAAEEGGAVAAAKGFLGSLWSGIKAINGSDANRMINAATVIEYEKARRKVIAQHPEWEGSWFNAPRLWASILWEQESDKFEELVNAVVDASDAEKQIPALAFLGRALTVGKRFTSSAPVQKSELAPTYGNFGAQLLQMREDGDPEQLKSYLKKLDMDVFVDQFAPLGIIPAVLATTGPTRGTQIAQLRRAVINLFGGTGTRIGLGNLRDNCTYMLDYLAEANHNDDGLDAVQTRKMGELRSTIGAVYTEVNNHYAQIFPSANAAAA